MEKQATSFYPLTQGEILYVLVFRAREYMGTPEVAEALGVRRESLPRIYKSQSLSKKVVMHACNLFNVPPSLFTETKSIEELSEKIEEVEVTLRAQINELRAENNWLKSRVTALERENQQLRAKYN